MFELEMSLVEVIFVLFPVQGFLQRLLILVYRIIVISQKKLMVQLAGINFQQKLIYLGLMEQMG